MDKLQFPEGFLWGASTSAHQVEGNTKNNWSKWEMENADRLALEAKTKWQPWQQKQFPQMFDRENYVTGKACDHYNRYEEDLDIAKQLNHNAHRFSIEWSRIEPEEGKFDEKEIEHYSKVIDAIRQRGMEPFLTLWHWTNPLWLEEKGGCEAKEFPLLFARYARIIADRFGNKIKFWITINEPMSVISSAYTIGAWPPQKKNPLKALKVYKILSDAHNQAYDAIHRSSPNAQVGFANILAYIEPSKKHSGLDNLVVMIAEYFSNKKFLKMTEGHNDFFALQYYFHHKLAFPGIKTNENKVVSDMNWDVYPEGTYHLLKWLGTFNLPIYITEMGIADTKDEKRSQYIVETLSWVHQAISEGVNVKGFFYWSLLDNFEWDKGYWPRFGLVEVDRKDLSRNIRASAFDYAKICQTNGLEL